MALRNAQLWAHQSGEVGHPSLKPVKPSQDIGLAAATGTKSAFTEIMPAQFEITEFRLALNLDSHLGHSEV